MSAEVPRAIGCGSDLDGLVRVDDGWVGTPINARHVDVQLDLVADRVCDVEAPGGSVVDRSDDLDPGRPKLGRSLDEIVVGVADLQAEVEETSTSRTYSTG